MVKIHRFFYKSLSSTNDYCQTQIEKSDSGSPFWVRTNHQYKGRGQGSKEWNSEAGMNLTGSFVFYPSDCLAEKQFAISVRAALAVSFFLELFLDQVQIKWPNDIYYRHNKIGGLLIENNVLGKRLYSSTIGIGININQTHFPPDLLNPVSLRRITGIKYDLNELEDLLLEYLREYFLLEYHQNDDELRNRYLKRQYRYKEYAPYRLGTQWIKARIIGTEADGRLVLETEDSSIIRIVHGEIDYIIQEE